MNDRLNEYREVLAILNGHATVSSFVNRLARVRAFTDDAVLMRHLGPVIEWLKDGQALATNRLATFNFQPDEPRLAAVLAYCVLQVRAAKPQWQVLALKHGWRPPRTP